MSFIDEVKRLNKERTQGVISRAIPKYITQPKYEAWCYIDTGKEFVGFPANGNKHNDCDFISLAPRMAKALLAIDDLCGGTHNPSNLEIWRIIEEATKI